MNWGSFCILTLEEFVGLTPPQMLAVLDESYPDYVHMFSNEEVGATRRFLVKESDLFSEWQEFVAHRRDAEPFPGYFIDGSLYIAEYDGDYAAYLSSNSKIRRLELWAQQYVLSRKRVSTLGNSPNYIPPLSSWR